MTPTETWITAIYEKDGERKAKRFPLNVPLDLATGQYERLSDLAIRESIKDLQAEQQRRKDVAKKINDNRERTGGWDPFAAAVRAA